MKTFNVNDWTAFKADVQFSITGRALEVRLVSPGSVSIVVKGKTYPVGYGSVVKAHIDGNEPFKVLCSSDGAFFAPPSRVVEDKGVPVTNADKRPNYSAVETIVRAALRKHEIDALAKKQKARAAFNEMQRQRKADGRQDEAPKPQPGEADYVPPPEPVDGEGQVDAPQPV